MRRQQFSNTCDVSLLEIAKRNPICFAVLEIPDQSALCLCSILGLSISVFTKKIAGSRIVILPLSLSCLYRNKITVDNVCY
jgi:hypothetical protein